MNLVWVIVLIFIVLAIFGAPGIGLNHSYGYGPSGLFGLIVLVLIILLLTGRL